MARCPGICRSTAEAVRGLPASGRRFVEGPGSSENGARLLIPERDLEEVRP